VDKISYYCSDSYSMSDEGSEVAGSVGSPDPMPRDFESIVARTT